jgi:GYF domain 2/Domain of unknown function (DUF4190)
MAAAEWYYTLNNQQQGPVTLEALQAMAANGQIQRTDLVWRQGMANWTAAGEVPGVFGGAPAAQAGWQGPAMGGPVGAYGGPQLGYGGYQQAQGASFAKEAKEAMIYSIVGLFCCGVILGPIGLIKGLNAQKQMQATGNFEGKGMATAAVIIGIIVTILSAIGLIFGTMSRMHQYGR